jgi:hypothetical protein
MSQELRKVIAKKLGEELAWLEEDLLEFAGILIPAILQWFKEEVVPKEKITQSLYEATRIEAEWSNRSIVPEKWEERDEKFKKQFSKIITDYLSIDKLPTPEEAHNSWMDAYIRMGWKYGTTRDVVAKTHPDMVPYEKLPQDEKDKDAIFLSFVWLTKNLLKDILTNLTKEG